MPVTCSRLNSMTSPTADAVHVPPTDPASQTSGSRTTADHGFHSNDAITGGRSTVIGLMAMLRGGRDERSQEVAVRDFDGSGVR